MRNFARKAALTATAFAGTTGAALAQTSIDVSDGLESVAAGVVAITALGAVMIGLRVLKKVYNKVG